MKRQQHACYSSEKKRNRKVIIGCDKEPCVAVKDMIKCEKVLLKIKWHPLCYQESSVKSTEWINIFPLKYTL